MASCAIHLPKPNVEIPHRYIYDLDHATTSVDGAWWNIYNDPVLDSLQRRALAANRDLAAAAERVFEFLDEKEPKLKERLDRFYKDLA